ncbi:MAG TPA: hypothetical protein VF708_09710 [Pyrinomonadaceae bacterium]|jgi:hypothetical protein
MPAATSAPAHNSPLVSSVASNQADRIIWTGRSGGYTLRWSTTEIKASAAKTPTDILFSARAIAKKDFDEFNAVMTGTDDPSPPDCTYERTFTLLSVVGSLVSLRDNYYSSCTGEAHPAGETRLLTLDLAKPGQVDYDEEMDTDINNPGKVIKLTDLFPETDIVQALLADPFVRKNMLNPEIKSTPKTLEEFLNSIAMTNSEEVCLTIDNDWLTRFAFHHIENGKIAVRLGFSGLGPCRERLTEIGLLLPIPTSLKSPLALAASAKEGFLATDIKRIAGGRVAKMLFRTGKGAQH